MYSVMEQVIINKMGNDAFSVDDLKTEVKSQMGNFNENIFHDDLKALCNNGIIKFHSDGYYKKRK